MPAALSAQLRSSFRDALVSAFQRAELKRFLAERLRTNLESITPAQITLEDAVFEVIAYFERRGRLDELAEAAAAENPGNAPLARFLADYRAAKPTMSDKEIRFTLAQIRNTIRVGLLFALIVLATVGTLALLGRMQLSGMQGGIESLMRMTADNQEQTTAIRNQLGHLQAQATEVKAQLADQQKQIGEVKAQLGDQQKQLTGIKGQLDGIKTVLEKLEKKP